MNKKFLYISVSLLFLVILAALYFLYRRKGALGRTIQAEKEDTIELEDKVIDLIYSPFFEPYDKQGKTTLKKITDATAGVYLIRKKGSDKVVYVGHSMKNLYKTLYRHFQSWEITDQYRVSYPKKGYEVCIILLSDDSMIQALERFLIFDLNPEDNGEKYEAYWKQAQEEEKNIDIELPEEVADVNNPNSPYYFDPEEPPF